jgi:hypothetical protein
MSTPQSTATNTHPLESRMTDDELEKRYQRIKTHATPWGAGGGIGPTDCRGEHHEMMAAFKKQGTRDLVKETFSHLRKNRDTDVQPSEREFYHNMVYESRLRHNRRDTHRRNWFTDNSLAVSDIDPDRVELFGPTCVAMLTALVRTPGETNLPVCEEKAKQFFEAPRYRESSLSLHNTC